MRASASDGNRFRTKGVDSAVRRRRVAARQEPLASRLSLFVLGLFLLTLPGGLIVLALPSAGIAQEALSVDPNLPPYEPLDGLEGTLISVGSDTLNNLMALWSDGFRRYYPHVRFEIEGKGSSTAPPALIAGTAQLGPMSREMKASEIDQFEARYGYPPAQIRVALDALAVYVHRDNPIQGLTIAQVDAIFSKSRLCGYPENVTTWGQVGLTGAFANRPISLYGRNSASGTYGFFKENALCGGDFKDEVKEQPGSASVVQGVTVDLYGIGYSGIGYRTSGVRAVPLAFHEGEPPAEPTLENVISGAYPLGRFLYIYINKTPGQPLEPVVREFLRYVLSREGQEAVIRAGYLPLPAEVVEAELVKLED